MLSVSQTVTDIVNALKAADASMTTVEQTAATTAWTAIINALYTRIKADMAISVLSTGGDPQGGVVSSTSTSVTIT